MSEERELLTPEGLTLSNAQVPSDEELREYKIRAVEIASRSQTLAALDIPIPSHLHGEWIPNNKNSLAEANIQGFVYPDADLINGSLHYDGTGRAIVGDTVFMVIPKWKKEILDGEYENRRQRIGKLGHVSKEEADFLAQAKNPAIGTTNESSSRTVYVTR